MSELVSLTGFVSKLPSLVKGSGSEDRCTPGHQPPRRNGQAAARQSVMVHGSGRQLRRAKCLQLRRLPECLVQKKTAAHFEALVGAPLAASRSRF
jgi:hypothetical protein